MLLTGGVWLSGIVLFINTSSITVYDTGFSYKVTGGIGPFSGSLVQPFLEFLQSLAPPDQKNQTIVPYTYSSVVNMLVMNSLVSTVASPVSCTDDGYGDCTSYLVTGGLEIVTPWIPPAEDNGEFTLARVNRVPSIQVDVSTLDTKESSFSDKDCDVFGKEGIIIGLKLCIAVDPKSLGSLRTGDYHPSFITYRRPAYLTHTSFLTPTGLFVCTNGTDNKTCHARDSEPFLPNITAQITFYTSQATIIASRSNYSIISVIDQTTPVPYPGFHTPTSTNSSTSINTTTPEQELQAYRTALHWLLDFSSSNIPPPSSLVELFWTASLQLSSPSTSTGILSQNLHSLLVFPFFLFNANNWGNLQTKQNETVEGLPQEFYTTASLVQGYDKVKFDSGMFILFLGLQGVAVVFVWGVLVWVWFGGKGGGKGRLPDISEFPLYDGAFKTRIVKRHGSDSDMASLANDGASTSEIIRDMKKYRVLLK